MADDGPRGVGRLRELFHQLEEAAEAAGDRMGEFVQEVEIRRRLSDAIDAVDDVRLEVLRRLPGRHAEEPGEEAVAEPASLAEMTVRELHELAREREIAGRSSMNKAQLIEALGES